MDRDDAAFRLTATNWPTEGKFTRRREQSVSVRSPVAVDPRLRHGLLVRSFVSTGAAAAAPPVVAGVSESIERSLTGESIRQRRELQRSQRALGLSARDHSQCQRRVANRPTSEPSRSTRRRSEHTQGRDSASSGSSARAPKECGQR